MIFRLGELFCGPGGLALGATTADIGDPNWKIIHQWASVIFEAILKTFAGISYESIRAKW